MNASVLQKDLTRVKKLALLPEEVEQSRWGVSVTRLTSLKSLCQDHEGERLRDSPPVRFYTESS
jgi:hypothetical protein